MILQGRQIFSHLEGKKSLPSVLTYQFNLYKSMPKEDRHLHPYHWLFYNMPKGRFSGKIEYTKEDIHITNVYDERERPVGFRDDLIKKLIKQKEERNKPLIKSKKRASNKKSRKFTITFKK